MQHTISKISDTEQTLQIILAADEYSDAYKQEFDEARNNIQIKGFRRGHAPAGLVKKVAGPSVEATVAEKMASRYFGELAEQEIVKPVNRAEIIDFNFGDNQLTIELGYEVHPEFELADMSSYSFVKARYVIEESDIDKEIQHMLSAQGTLVSVDEPAGENDTVVGDVWKLDANNEPDEAHKTSNHHFSLQYLPKENPFRVALIGKKAGETAEVATTAASDDEEVSRFRIVISEIKRLELPELTDELVSEVTDQKFSTIADFRVDIRSKLEKHFTQTAEDELLEAISEKLIEENPVPAPKSVIASFTNMLFENAKQQTGGQFPKHFDEAQFRETLHPNALKHAQWMIITRKIADTQQLAISDEEIKSHLEKQTEKLSSDEQKQQMLDSFNSREVREYVAEIVFKEKLYTYLKANVTITEEDKPISAITEEQE